MDTKETPQIEEIPIKSDFFEEQPKAFFEEAEDDAINGIEIKEYAKKLDLKVGEVWRRIRRGALIARTENGFVYVYSQNATPLPLPLESAESKICAQSPEEIQQVIAEKNLPDLPKAKVISKPETSELGLLVEHLTATKKENTQVINMSQRSIEKITEISQDLLATKDQLLKIQESEIAKYQNLVDQQNSEKEQKEKEIKKLKAKIEDLEMLNAALEPNR